MTNKHGVCINYCHDSGNIGIVNASEQTHVLLNIRKDANSDFLQWFNFSASGLKDQTTTFIIENAAQTTYPDGWKDYDVVVSSDRQSWGRVPTRYEDGKLSWTVNSEFDQLWFAYFAPYTLHQHADLINAAATCPAVRHEVLATTHQGRPVDYLNIQALSGSAADRQQLWVIARQHPGEAMAEWFVEGWLERLLDENDATSCALRELADIHVVPNMNPDGSYLGHLRTNALGINLNREWAEPSEERSPEVFHVLERMRRTGITLALDVHGDEALPYNFIAGTEGIHDWTPERNTELVNLKHTWSCLNPDFQDVYGYPINQPGKANLTICSNQLAHQFGALALTLEMPFKDTANNPRPQTGWSPERCLRLGTSFVDVAYLALSQRLLAKTA